MNKSFGRKGKPQGLVIEENPLVVNLTKNGRAISEGNALRFLAKHFPRVTKWVFRKTDHSLQATEQDCTTVTETDIAAQVAKAHRCANTYEAAGYPVMAGLLRVEAANISDRPKDWKPIHKPSIGRREPPHYDEDNPFVCVHCGLALIKVAIPDSKYFINHAVSSEGNLRYCDQRLLD